MALTPTTWNPSDKGSACTLSNGNLTGSAPAANGTVRSVFGASSGKWYWEIKTTSTTYSPGIGVGTASAALTNYPGSNSGGWAWFGNEGKKYTNGVGTAYGSAGSIAGVTIGVALDMDAGTVTLYRNGVSMGTMYSGLTGTIYAMCGGNASVASNFTANFGATAFDYSPPAGHNAGFGTVLATINGTASTTVGVTSAAAGTAPVSAASSSTVAVTSAASGAVLATGAASAAVAVTSSAAGAVEVKGQASTAVAVASLADGALGAPEAMLTGTTTVGVSSAASGAVAVQGLGGATVTVTSSASGVVRSGAELSGSTAVEVDSASAAAVLAAGQGTSTVTVTSLSSGTVPARGQASASVAVSSVAAGVAPVAAVSDNAVQVGSAAAGAVAISGQAAAVVGVTSVAKVRNGIRDFTRDVSVTTMLREISLRASVPNVVARTDENEITVTTHAFEIAITA